jgi:uncharacterized protein (TIGR02266 family)
MSAKAARKSRGKQRVAQAIASESESAPPRSSIRPMAPELDSAEEAAVKVLGAVLEGIAAPLGVASGSPVIALAEHRAHARVGFEVEIDLHSESHFFSGLSGDVSEGGLFVQTYRPLALGDRVQVAFDLPDGRVEAEGIVRWRRPQSDSVDAGVGLEFESLSDRDRDVIRRFCEKRAPLYYEL